METKKDPKDVLREEMLGHPNLAEFFQQVQNTKIEIKGEVILRMLVDDFIENGNIQEAIDELDLEHSRCCSECGKPMYEGFCIENGAEYYCSEECLHKNISEEEYAKLYDDGRGDSYWTSWLD